VGAGTQIAGTVVVVHQVTSQAVFPNTRVELGRGSRLELVECYVGGDGALVVPVSEYIIGDNAELHVATYQRLATTSWHVARTTTHLARDARMRQLIIGLGGHYNRSRNDAEFDGTGSTNELHTTFLGAGDQVHDFRTRQYHRIGRSTSNLLSKGAVADHARSVYTGLIEIEKGAKRTDARQRNLNLLLAPTAHADTVPNLDIRENDVMCAHASSVGPLDEMQRWYLESRGVERNAAERLLVQGFFNEMTDSMPTGIAKMVDRDVAKVLETTQLVTP
jgi:Fe-S cluster assembly protein SufD